MTVYAHTYISLITALCIAACLAFTPSISHGKEKNAEDQPEYTSATNPENFTTGATFRSLNKITAQVSTLKVTQDQPSSFGNLTVILKECWKAPPEEQPESKSLIEVWEQVPGEEKKLIFNGWMFASSPSLSALEHPVYDLTLRSCDEAESKPANKK